jgi:1-acyl-sn-glycerol-3-phosphate acyltransferase
MLQGIARFILRISGWTIAGELPTDGFWLLVYKTALDVEVHFLAKHTLFWWPLGSILRAMGAIPVDRAVSASTVQQVVDAFSRRDRFWFALSPEGTRKWQPHWKTGFYRIAKAANVPIVLAFMDYRKKRMGIGITLPENRNLVEDLKTIRDFYAPFSGRVPERQGPIEFPPDSNQSKD